MCVLKNTLADINMKSFTILAFGLVVLVAISVAYPMVAEEEDYSTDELAMEDEGCQMNFFCSIHAIYVSLLGLKQHG